MKQTIKAAVATLILLGLVGCATPASTKPSDARSDVTDVHPMEAAYSPASYKQTAPATPYQPTYDASSPILTAPQPLTTETPAFIAPTSSQSIDTDPGITRKIAGKSTHIVRPGETLFAISKNAYGTGKKWRLIAKANKISSTKLKVGQKLIIP